MTRLNWRTLLNPAAVATRAKGRSVSSSSRRAKWARRLRRDLGRGGSDVNVEEAPQVTRAHPEPGRERVLGGVVERTVGDGAERPAHELGSLDPTGARARDRADSGGTGGSPRPRPRPPTCTAGCCAPAVLPQQPGRQ